MSTFASRIIQCQLAARSPLPRIALLTQVLVYRLGGLEELMTRQVFDQVDDVNPARRWLVLALWRPLLNGDGHVLARPELGDMQLDRAVTRDRGLHPDGKCHTATPLTRCSRCACCWQAVPAGKRYHPQGARCYHAAMAPVPSRYRTSRFPIARRPSSYFLLGRRPSAGLPAGSLRPRPTSGPTTPPSGQAPLQTYLTTASRETRPRAHRAAPQCL